MSTSLNTLLLISKPQFGGTFKLTTHIITLNCTSLTSELDGSQRTCFLLVNEVNTEPKSRKDMPKTSYSKPTIGATGETGSWRTFDPVVNYDECNRCRTCWLHCPEAVISLDEDGTPHTDYDYCKGCGICAAVCPKQCIEMVRTDERKRRTGEV